MFHWERGLFLTSPRLALDVQRRQPHAFVSHAHADHIAAHQIAYCTPPTAMLYQHRMGQHRRTFPLEYRKPVDFAATRLTAFPAGHCLGSAMLLAETNAGSVLYTGDFKLGPSATAETAELPRADVLIMESTFGRPQYRMPPREEVVNELIDLARRTLEAGDTPVIHAYALGKAQEATAILTRANIPVMQHREILAVSEIYLRCGMDLGDVRAYDASTAQGCAIVTLPRRARHYRLPGLVRPVSIALTGWAVDRSTKYRWKVDYALPLSDHADFDQLLQAAAEVGAATIYCTHGPREFVDHLREAGFDARPVEGSYQTRLF